MIRTLLGHKTQFEVFGGAHTLDLCHWTFSSGRGATHSGVRCLLRSFFSSNLEGVYAKTGHLNDWTIRWCIHQGYCRDLVQTVLMVLTRQLNYE
jgi:hypothetical protein